MPACAPCIISLLKYPNIHVNYVLTVRVYTDTGNMYRQNARYAKTTFFTKKTFAFICHCRKILQKSTKNSNSLIIQIYQTQKFIYLKTHYSFCTLFKQTILGSVQQQFLKIVCPLKCIIPTYQNNADSQVPSYIECQVILKIQFAKYNFNFFAMTHATPKSDLNHLCQKASLIYQMCCNDDKMIIKAAEFFVYICTIL